MRARIVDRDGVVSDFELGGNVTVTLTGHSFDPAQGQVKAEHTFSGSEIAQVELLGYEPPAPPGPPLPTKKIQFRNYDGMEPVELVVTDYGPAPKPPRRRKAPA